jgi:hypothetical protein
MSVYVTGIGTMRQPTVQSAVVSIIIWCNLYGSHTVVFTIKQTIFVAQYLDRMTTTLKELKQDGHHQMFVFTISPKRNMTSTFVFGAKHKIFTYATQFLFSQKPHTL